MMMKMSSNFEESEDESVSMDVGVSGKSCNVRTGSADVKGR